MLDLGGWNLKFDKGEFVDMGVLSLGQCRDMVLT